MQVHAFAIASTTGNVVSGKALRSSQKETLTQMIGRRIELVVWQPASCNSKSLLLSSKGVCDCECVGTKARHVW